MIRSVVPVIAMCALLFGCKESAEKAAVKEEAMIEIDNMEDSDKLIHIENSNEDSLFELFGNGGDFLMKAKSKEGGDDSNVTLSIKDGKMKLRATNKEKGGEKNTVDINFDVGKLRISSKSSNSDQKNIRKNIIHNKDGSKTVIIENVRKVEKDSPL